MALPDILAEQLEEAAKPLIAWLRANSPENSHRVIIQPPTNKHARWCIALESRTHINVTPD